MSFDPNAFMSSTVDAPQGDTTRPLVPEGDYVAMIDAVDPEKHFRHGTSQKDPSKPPRDWAQFTPNFVLQAPEVAAQLGLEKVTCRHNGMFLDLDSNGGLDWSKGKNVDLNRLRDAVGQNVAGPWNFGMLSGAGPLMVKVTHSTNPKNNEKFANVTRVAKVS